MGPNKCPLCSGNADYFQNNKTTEYFRCNTCRALFMNPEHYLNRHEEKERYLEHNNDVHDPRYQNFVSPIVNCIKKNFKPGSRGLDFGSGTGPVITKVLKDQGYNISTYDLYFDNRPELLKGSYDYIACCEVIEHFHNPAGEFSLLRSMLNHKGKLICMTDLYDDTIDFSRWYYKDDPTHVFFYHTETLDWIKTRFRFSSLTINKRLIELTS